MCIDEIYIMKDGKNKGTVSIKFSDKDSYLTIGGIIIDMSDVASPVRSLKANDQDIIRGPVFDNIIPAIIESFIEIQNDTNGLYIINEDGVKRG